MALAIAAYWARHGGRRYIDEYEGEAVAALGLAAIRFRAGGPCSFEQYARNFVHQRCHDMRRKWFVTRRGERIQTADWLTLDWEIDMAVPEVEADDLPEWLQARLHSLVGATRSRKQRNSGLPSRRACEATLAWSQGLPMAEVAAHLGVVESRVSQMAREVVTYLRAELEEAV